MSGGTLPKQVSNSSTLPSQVPKRNAETELRMEKTGESTFSRVLTGKGRFGFAPWDHLEPMRASRYPDMRRRATRRLRAVSAISVQSHSQDTGTTAAA